MGVNKILIIGLAVAAVVAAGYFIFFRENSLEPVLTSGESGAALSASAQADRELLHLLQELESITFDTTIFNDAAFQSLKDFRIEPTPEPVGRRNPFAPPGRN